MRLIFLVVIFGWLQSVYSKTNSFQIDTTLLPDYQLTIAPEDQVFELPTPDYLAFSDTVLTKGCANNGLAKYNGYGKALKNGIDWKAGCIIKTVNKFKYNQDTCWISLIVFHQSSNRMIQRINFSIVDFEIGKNIKLKKIDYSNNVIQNRANYYDLIQDGCSFSSIYLVDENATSFIRIVDYNKETKLLKARFKLHLKLDYFDIVNAKEKNPPKEIIFDDGVVYALNLAK